MKNNNGVVEIAIDAGSEALGSAVGVGIGAMVAGPVGAIGGATLGSLASTIVRKMGNEIQARLLSPNEAKRIGEVFDNTVSKIQENLDAGKCYRDDGFFEDEIDGRSQAEELFEGTLQAAQREYEERKLPFIANLYANIAFDESIDRPMANRLIKIATDITYRQLVILNVIGLLQIQANDDDTRVKTSFDTVTGLSEVGIVSDIYDLIRLALVFSSEAVLDPAGINPSKLELGGYGAHLFNLMELGATEFDDDANDVLRVLVENFMG